MPKVMSSSNPHFNGNSEFALSTVIHEVLIKKDIKEGRISLFDWTKCGLDEDITFGIEDLEDDIEHFYIMTIHPDGTFIIKEQENNLFEMNEYSDFYDIFETAKVSGETVKAVIRDTQGNINIIKDTGMITFPESEAIAVLLKDGDNRLRGKERREELLSSCLDIKMLKEESGCSYFVGTIGEGMRWSIPRAANIRHIEPYKDSKLLFENLLSLMNVTFVHNGQLTVLPFPFKYLREYVNNLKRAAE